MAEALAEPVHAALGGHMIVSTEVLSDVIEGSLDITKIRLHLDDGNVVEVSALGVHAEGWIDFDIERPDRDDKLAGLAAEFVAADQARRLADERWKESVVALMHDYVDFVPGEGVIAKDVMNEAVLAAFEAAGIEEPFEALANVVCGRARIRREFPEG